MRKQKATSRAAHESIKPAKQYYHDKIIAGLEKLKVGGTFFEISEASEIKPEQAWKRLSEMARAGIIFDTGITRKLPSNRMGTVWQLMSLNFPNTVIRNATQTDYTQQELFP